MEWLYATKEHESARSVAELMANTIQTALEEAESSSTRSQDWDRVKLRSQCWIWTRVFVRDCVLR
jgi:hypothetical protein